MRMCLEEATWTLASSSGSVDTPAMCRLFGFRSNVPSGAHRSLVEAENAVALQASAHSDGWGIGYFLGEEAYILKSDAGAASDERFQRISRRLQSHTFVVHVRSATVGDVDQLNSHPFRHGAWMFAHNGTLFDFHRYQDKLLAQIHPSLRNLIFGSTDSERLFYYLISSLGRAGVPFHGRATIDVAMAAATLRSALSQIYAWAEEAGCHPPIANYILTNGRVFFAQRAGLELFLASQKIHCGDFHTCAEPRKTCMDVMPPLSMYRPNRLPEGPLRRVTHVVVVSEPIGDEDIWEEIPDGMLVILDENFQLYCRPAPEGFRTCPHPPAPAPRPQMQMTRPFLTPPLRV
jgi:predicted glutamine amidotransferase